MGAATKALCWLILLFILLSGCHGHDPAIVTWEHAQSGVYDAAYSDDGRFAVVSTIAEGALFWDLVENKSLYKWQHNKHGENTILNIDFSPDGNWVITAEENTYVIWSTATGQALGYWEIETDINDVAISNQGKYVLLGLKDGRALHINQNTRRRLEVVAHRYDAVASVDLSPDGRIAVTGGYDHRALAWDAETGKEIASFEHQSRVSLVVLDRQTNHVFSADNKGHAFIWEVHSGQKVSQLRLKERQYNISAAHFSEDGAQLLTGSPGRIISSWDSRTGTHLKSWKAATRGPWIPKGAIVYAVAFVNDGQSIVAEISNGYGQRWTWTGLSH
jgi:WD40 repeat protein